MTAFGLVVLALAGFIYAQQPICNMITREQWGAEKPKNATEKWPEPVPFVIIHHSYIPAACYSTEDCKIAMRSMQHQHQVGQGWNDIGYNFGIGGDGKIYEGRGYNVTGAHSKGYNTKALGICLIGDWRTELPPKKMLQAAKKIISVGLSKGYINPNYKLIGHRQVRPTECPGDRLMKEISTWNNSAPDYIDIIKN